MTHPLDHDERNTLRGIVTRIREDLGAKPAPLGQPDRRIDLVLLADALLDDHCLLSREDALDRLKVIEDTDPAKGRR